MHMTKQTVARSSDTVNPLVMVVNAAGSMLD